MVSERVQILAGLRLRNDRLGVLEAAVQIVELLEHELRLVVVKELAWLQVYRHVEALTDSRHGLKVVDVFLTTDRAKEECSWVRPKIEGAAIGVAGLLNKQ